MDRIPYYGWGGVTTPGAVSAWVALAEGFGTLPFDQALRARDPLRPRRLPRLSPRPRTTGTAPSHLPEGRPFPAWHDTFAPGGAAPGPGDLVRLPDHARHAPAIAETNGLSLLPRASSHGIDAARSAGRACSAPTTSPPMPYESPASSIDYRGLTLHEIPPNGQGIVALIALGILNHFDSRGSHPTTPPACTSRSRR
jgi:gamma-glutamyltranspeptidase/glutathione hydrolase